LPEVLAIVGVGEYVEERKRERNDDIGNRRCFLEVAHALDASCLPWTWLLLTRELMYSYLFFVGNRPSPIHQ
jgi:hypothetical protein